MPEIPSLYYDDMSSVSIFMRFLMGPISVEHVVGQIVSCLCNRVLVWSTQRDVVSQRSKNTFCEKHSISLHHKTGGPPVQKCQVILYTCNSVHNFCKSRCTACFGNFLKNSNSESFCFLFASLHQTNFEQKYVLNESMDPVIKLGKKVFLNQVVYKDYKIKNILCLTFQKYDDDLSFLFH